MGLKGKILSGFVALLLLLQLYGVSRGITGSKPNVKETPSISAIFNSVFDGLAAQVINAGQSTVVALKLPDIFTTPAHDLPSNNGNTFSVNKNVTSGVNNLAPLCLYLFIKVLRI